MTFEDLAQRIESHVDRQDHIGATEDDISLAEEALGVPLTGGYRQFLRAFGWCGIGPFELYGLGAQVPEYLHLVAITRSERHEMRPRLPLYLIPIMNDGGGNLLCLDTRVSEPPIVLWDHEQGEGQEPEPEATSFIEWLCRLLDHLPPQSVPSG
jgi:hypothetical protein